jgi:thiamine monophosphate kinase
MRTLDLSQGSDIQASILQKLDLGVKKTLEEFGINALGGDLVESANQLLPENSCPENSSVELKI